MTTSEELKARIDAMTQEELATHWRFAPIGDPLLQGPVGEYFAQVFRNRGGMTPTLSKTIGHTP